LAEIAHRLGRKALEELAAVARPDTLLAWYRKLIANKFDGSKFRKFWGRPRIGEETERLVVRMAKENPGWGYDRIVGAMANLGHRLSDQAVGNILRRHDIPPASGDRFLHGGSAYAQRVDYVLRDVFRSFGEPEDMLGGSHISSGSRVDGTDGAAHCDERCATTKPTIMRKEITKAKTTYCYSLCRLKQSVENRERYGVGSGWGAC